MRPSGPKRRGAWRMLALAFGAPRETAPLPTWLLSVAALRPVRGWTRSTTL